MVSDPPTPRESSCWRISVTLTLSGVMMACSTLLDIPGDPYVVEPSAPTELPPETPAALVPMPGDSADPDRPEPPDLEIDDVQSGSGSSGSSSESGDAAVPTDVAPGSVSDGGVPRDAAAPVAVPDAAAVCPAGSTLGPSGRCYVAVANTLTWPAAQTSCKALGTGWDLAAIHDTATNTFLGTLLDVEAWVGASDAVTEGEWVWVIDGVPFFSGDGDTGVAVNGQLEIWAGGEPNGEADSNCARLVPNPARWADLECDTLRASLCEGPPL